MHQIALENRYNIGSYTGSLVFLSFGEIKCRPDEGFITAAVKLSKTEEELSFQQSNTFSLGSWRKILRMDMRSIF